MVNYEYITSKERAVEVLSGLSKTDVLYLDTETNGLDPIGNKILLVQLAIPPAEKAFVFDRRYTGNKRCAGLEIFREILEDWNILKVIQKASFDSDMFLGDGSIEINNTYCTMETEQRILGHMETGTASLSALALKYAGIPLNKEVRMSFVGVDLYSDYKYTKEQLEYAALDALVLHKIFLGQTTVV